MGILIRDLQQVLKFWESLEKDAKEGKLNPFVADGLFRAIRRTTTEELAAEQLAAAVVQNPLLAVAWAISDFEHVWNDRVRAIYEPTLVTGGFDPRMYMLFGDPTSDGWQPTRFQSCADLRIFLTKVLSPDWVER